jgi:glutamate-1-semialdehyde 2,1-aminomutase
MDVDTERFGRYHAALLSQGVLEPAFATGDRRLNAATTEDDVDRTIEAVRFALEASG